MGLFKKEREGESEGERVRERNDKKFELVALSVINMRVFSC